MRAEVHQPTARQRQLGDIELLHSTAPAYRTLGFGLTGSCRPRFGCTAPWLRRENRSFGRSHTGGSTGSLDHVAFRYCFLAPSVFPFGAGSSTGRYPFGKDLQMPNVAVNAPVSSAASDRLALGVGPVRPGAGGIGGTLSPSSFGRGVPIVACFAGSEE